MTKTIDVMGIGNPLMDVIVMVDEKELAELDLSKGSMTLVDEDRLLEVEDKLKHKKGQLIPGGSVANTLVGFAMLGGDAVFVGMTGDDEHGDIYEQKLEGGNVHSKIVKDTGTTGRVISLVTPDSERTFVTFLGMCLKLRKENIIEDDIKSAKILHLTGYQLEDKGLRATSLHAIELAKKHGTKVSIDLADPGLVKRNKDDLLDIIKDADILFANAEEIEALTGKGPKESLKELKWIDTLVIKIGSKGSMVRHHSKEFFTEAKKAEAVDTTGAGDMYAAAMLYGLTHKMDIQKSMEAASHIAARVVETVGARIDDAEDIKKLFS